MEVAEEGVVAVGESWISPSSSSSVSDPDKPSRRVSVTTAGLDDLDDVCEEEPLGAVAESVGVGFFNRNRSDIVLKKSSLRCSRYEWN